MKKHILSCFLIIHKYIGEEYSDAETSYTMRRKENERERERYFHYTFYLIMRLISVYTVYTE